jgi:transcription antitermination factor NusG
MVRKSRLRRDRYQTLRKNDVDCFLGSSCVWPECTCPAREGTGRVWPEDVHLRGRTVYRSPAGPYIPRRRRPEGWSPLSDWVLVRTKTRHENYAALQCRQQDIETWNPRCYEPGNGKPVALFPGYLFAKPGDKFRKLRNTLGVIDVLMMGGGPDYVPKAIMKALRANADEEGIVTLPAQRKPKEGERVQIKIGAWQGFEGLYDGLNREGRIKVLLEFMGKPVKLTFRKFTSVEVVEQHES